jgi:antitoxin (DNA-binding transcriptional repressor) of toxin-antitoxin stability system
MEGLAMTYTLAMAAEQGIRIAKDGTPEVSMTDARAHLTAFVRGVRWGKKVSAFTERGERSAYVVPTEFFDRTRVLQRALDLLKERDAGLYEEVLAQATVEARTREGRRPDDDVF